MHRTKSVVTALSTAAACVALAGAAAVHGPASASGSNVTRGSFHEFAVGAQAGLDIGGDALMVRNGRHTVVSIRVSGLQPGTTYAAHVHAASCATAEADGHYMHDPAGAAAPPNEIWPGPITASRHGNARGFTRVDFTAGPTAVSVVIHQPGPVPNKIACADLS